MDQITTHLPAGLMRVERAATSYKSHGNDSKVAALIIIIDTHIHTVKLREAHPVWAGPKASCLELSTPVQDVE